MSDSGDDFDAGSLSKGAPEAKRAHHATEPLEGHGTLPSEGKEPTPKAAEADAAVAAAPPAPAPVPAPAPAAAAAHPGAATAAPVAPVASPEFRGAFHPQCRSVDVYKKITEIGKGTYGFVVPELI